MTSLLRRKRRITVRATIRAARTLCSLFAALLTATAWAQQPYPGLTPQAAEPRAEMPQTLPTARQQPDRPRTRPGQPLPRGDVIQPEMGLNPNQEAPVTIQLEPPGLERLAQSVQSDAQLKERIRQENRERKTPERIVFPSDPVLSYDTYRGRKWLPTRMETAPYYVCSGRLYFQQLNFERYGWDLGIITPFIEEAAFLWDVATIPYQMLSQPLRRFEYNNGWALPGDPMPLLLYPMEVSASGLVAEAGIIACLIAVFP